MALAKGFIPFVASFFVLFSIWRGQFDFFRRYGLEDPPTVWLTGLLLVLVLFLNAVGFFGIAVVFSFLYRHAARQRDKLQLNAVELFDTIAMQRRWMRAAMMAGALLIWSGSLLAIGDHMHARDNVFSLVYFGGAAVVFGLAASQVVLRRSQARERSALARPAGDDIVPVLVD